MKSSPDFFDFVNQFVIDRFFPYLENQQKICLNSGALVVDRLVLLISAGLWRNVRTQKAYQSQGPRGEEKN